MWTSDGTRCGSVGDIEQVRAWAEQDQLTIIIIGHVWDVVEHRRGERWDGEVQYWTAGMDVMEQEELAVLDR